MARDVDKWQAVHRAQQDTIIEVEVSPNSFADYLRQNDYAPGLKRLVGFSADQGEVIAGRQVAVTNDRPWRLTDLTFVPAGNGRERATINGVEVIRENGRYWIITPSGPIWSNIDERGVDPALNYLFGKKRQQQEQSSQ
jgi:hypothetical protein